MSFDKLHERLSNITNLDEGFLELLHEIPGIDDRGREILLLAHKHGIMSDITEMPGDLEPDIETMSGDLVSHLSQIADYARDEKKKIDIRKLVDYYEKHSDDKGITAGGYLQYLVIPLAIDGLKEEGLWDEQMNAPKFELKDEALGD